MARIALAWEYGASFGHAAALARLGSALRARGHDVALALRELRTLSALPEANALQVFQAPAWNGNPPPFLPRTMAEIMAGAGYADQNSLSGLLSAWHVLFAGWKPDLVITDFAPTALLAARALGVRRATYGNGFFTPPRATPLPAFRLDVVNVDHELAATEGHVLGIVNGALGRLGAAPLERLAQQFETEEDFLCTFPELDHYGARANAGYWGPRLSADRGRHVNWPEGNAKRVLVYLPENLPALGELFAALRARGHFVMAYIPQLDARRRAALGSPRIRFADGPMRLDGLLARCDLCISLGGDIAGGTLASGIPQLLFPMQYEQHLTAMRFENLGVGIGLRSTTPDLAAGATGGVAEALDRLLAQPAHALAARAFRARYPAWSPSEQLRRVVVRIEEIVR